MSEIRNKINRLSRKKSQAAMILAYISAGNSITADESKNKFGCARLAARICDLRNLGHDINTEMIHNKLTNKRYAKYTLISAKEMI